MNRNLPGVGRWYRHGDGQPFRVNAVDADAGCVELQYIDGMIDVMPMAHWHALALEPVESTPDERAPQVEACNDADERMSAGIVGAPYAAFDAVDGIVDGDAALLAAEL
ncbi:MAG: DUF6763 family protein, partial [Gammaproteobacteria bacterium]